MKARHQRLFIAVDEWLGAALCLYLWKTQDQLFWPVLIIWVVMIYGISYPWYWLSHRKPRASSFKAKPTTKIYTDGLVKRDVQ